MNALDTHTTPVRLGTDMHTMDDSENYYATLRRLFFSGQTDWRREWRDSRGTPRISFQLDREFNDTANFLAFDFFVELYQRFGNPIVPVHFEDGCISVAAQVSAICDFSGRDIRHLFIADSRYHDVFRRYGVLGGYMYGFPPENVSYHAFRINELGVPQPY